MSAGMNARVTARTTILLSYSECPREYILPLFVRFRSSFETRVFFFRLLQIQWLSHHLRESLLF